MTSTVIYSSRTLLRGFSRIQGRKMNSIRNVTMAVKDDDVLKSDTMKMKIEPQPNRSMWNKLIFKRKDEVIKEEMISQKAMEVGDTVVVNKLVSVGDVDDFCELTGDYNTVHTESRIVHGAFLNALVSSVIGTILPGPGSIVLSQRLEFPHSCVAPQCVTVTVALTSVRKIIGCDFECRTMDGAIVMKGDAKLMKK